MTNRATSPKSEKRPEKWTRFRSTACDKLGYTAICVPSFGYRFNRARLLVGLFERFSYFNDRGKIGLAERYLGSQRLQSDQYPLRLEIHQWDSRMKGEISKKLTEPSKSISPSNTGSNYFSLSRFNLC